MQCSTVHKIEHFYLLVKMIFSKIEHQLLTKSLQYCCWIYYFPIWNKTKETKPLWNEPFSVFWTNICCHGFATTNHDFIPNSFFDSRIKYTTVPSIYVIVIHRQRYKDLFVGIKAAFEICSLYDHDDPLPIKMKPIHNNTLK